MIDSSDESRRRFLAAFSSMTIGATLLPGALWAQVQREGANEVSPAMLASALAVAGLAFSDAEERALLRGVNQNLVRYRELRKLSLPLDTQPPFYFSALLPGMQVDRTRRRFRPSSPKVSRPASLEELAFRPVVELAELLRTQQVSSIELTEMYLARLHTYNARLNCVVTFLDDLARTQAHEADAEIAAGRYKGPLHGIPWGAKDIISVKGYRTTWGSGAFKEQVFLEDASVVGKLREAGAVLVAKLASGELASGDRWWGGQTRNPWDNRQGSWGSSAGPASATAAGLVGFAIGSETSGSILHPSSRCGVTGLRPTFGRVSRHGVMALSWTQDRLGPLCRCAEDCALVLHAIAGPDDRDLSVSEIPFNWDARTNLRTMRVGYLKESFDETTDPLTREHNEKTLAQIRALGLTLVPVMVPNFDADVSGFGVESAAFFDQMIRSSGDQKMTNPSRAIGMRAARLVPAVEYLQSQRARSVMMQELAKSTAAVDVYLAPADRSVTGADPDKTGSGGAGEGGGSTGRSSGPTMRHFNMANLAGYPALAVPNGFNESGAPGSIIFYGRPFCETQLLALTQRWQDTSGFQRKQPDLDAQPLLKPAPPSA